MQTKIILLFSLLLLIFFANAQEVSDENILELFDCDLIESGLFLNSNLSIINQVENGNEMISFQQHEGRIALNILIADQNGIGNSGYIQQVGAAHLSVLIQNGAGNEANLWSKGDATATIAYQNGDDNFINSYIKNQRVFPKSALLMQEGNNNSIELALIGNGFLNTSWPKAAVVVQQGNDLELSAKLDSYQSPLYITQQSGIYGGGMEINISNSAFNFPMK